VSQPRTEPSAVVEFPIRLQRGLRPILHLFGVRSGKATVRLTITD
jgi:hypothetical protein